MKKVIALTISIITIMSSQKACAQLFENFSDGDFTNNPAWVGGGSDFIVNPALQLQSNNMVANSTYQISTTNALATSAQWEFYVKIEFNPSSLNYIDAFLTASASDLTLNSTTGYFVRIGNTDDEICLYRKDASGVVTKIIDGANGILNVSSSTMKIKVVRNAANQWTLYRDLTGTGNTYSSEGSVTDATFSTSAFFGFLVKQSTASFFQKHYFDDIEIKAYVPDVTPPAIQSVSAPTPNTVDVLFNETVDLTSSQTVGNYVVNNGIGSPTSAVRDATNSALVHLTFASNFPNGVNNTITINNVQDLSGNAIVNGTATFSFYIPQRYDIVIDEIMADPTPQVQLPNAEFIELKNTSGKTINLQGWKLTTASSTSGLFPSYVLPADSFVVITGTSSVASFTQYGRAIGISSFPALPNDAGVITLMSKENLTIHSVSYNLSWYQNALKSDGGWTLEMIDTKSPCAGASNWKASIDNKGGTPAAKNSIDGTNTDSKAPALLRAAAIDNTTLLLTFDEPLDSAKAATAGNYSVNNSIGTPASAIVISPAFNTVQLKLTAPLVLGTIYTVTATNVTDCKGNIINALNTAKVGLASPIDSLGIIINEVLFNPKPNVVDYVEIFNRSSKIYDLKDLFIANRSSTTNAIGSIRQVVTTNQLIFPGEFYALSENGAIVKQNYNTTNPDNFIDISSFPSYPDASGTVVLLNTQGTIVDELKYDEKWHFALIDNEEGISLERVDYNQPTQNKDNWHSAASTVGFGTPAYQNSQFRADVLLQGDVTITPKTFSPDNDGFEDFTNIKVQVPAQGYVANITIYDAQGRPVKALVKNATLALTGSFRWDGLDDKQRKVPVGAYVVYTEVFNLDGKKRTFKNTVIVAARF